MVPRKHLHGRSHAQTSPWNEGNVFFIKPSHAHCSVQAFPWTFSRVNCPTLLYLTIPYPALTYLILPYPTLPYPSTQILPCKHFHGRTYAQTLPWNKDIVLCIETFYAHCSVQAFPWTLLRANYLSRRFLKIVIFGRTLAGLTIRRSRVIDV